MQCREVSGEREPAGCGGWVKMTCAVLRDDMRRNVDVRGLFLLIDPRNKKGPCFASQGAQTLPLSRGLAQLSKLSEPLFCLCSATFTFVRRPGAAGTVTVDRDIHPFVWTHGPYRFNKIAVFFSHNKSASTVFSASRIGPYITNSQCSGRIAMQGIGHVRLAGKMTNADADLL